MVWRKISTVFLRMYYVRVKGERNFWIFTVAKQFPLFFFFFGISKGISLLRSLFLPFLQIFSGKIVDSCTLGDLSFRGG